MTGNLFDYAAGRKLAEEGMTLALEGAPSTWPGMATQVVLDVGRMRPTFTSDDVWSWMENRGMPTPANRSALGPIMRALATDGTIVSTGEWRNSHRPETHTRPLRVWRLR